MFRVLLITAQFNNRSKAHDQYQIPTAGIVENIASNFQIFDARNAGSQGQVVALLRAYDKSTGEDIAGEVNMPAKQTGSPMSYLHNSKQYIVIAVSGQGNAGAEILAYALP